MINFNLQVDPRNVGSSKNAKEHMIIGIFDDLSENEMNLQMYNLNDVRDLMTRPCRVREFQTEKADKLVKAFGKTFSKKHKRRLSSLKVL